MSISTGSVPVESISWGPYDNQKKQTIIAFFNTTEIITGASGSIILAKKRSTVRVLTEQKMCLASFKGTTVLQTSTTTLSLQRGKLVKKINVFFSPIRFSN